MASRTVSCSSVKPDVSMSFLWGVMEKGRAMHFEGWDLRKERREAVRIEDGSILDMMKDEEIEMLV